MIRTILILTCLLPHAIFGQMASSRILFEGDSVLAFFNPKLSTCIRDYHEVYDCLPDSLNWNGPVVKFFDSIPNPKRIELKGQYSDGKRQGRWTWNFDDGTPREIRNYKEGKLNGQYLRYDHNGQIMCDCNLQNDQMHGRNRFWFKYEDMWHVGDYDKGETVGKHTMYSEDSMFVIIEEYDQGDFLVISSEYGDGKLLRVRKRTDKREYVYEADTLVEVIDFRKLAKAREKEKLVKEREKQRRKDPYERGYYEIMPNFIFDSISLQFDTLFYPSMARLATVMKDHPNIVVDLGVHVNSKGTIELCQKLCQKIVNYLRDQNINLSRIVAKAYANSAPLYSDEYLSKVRSIRKREKLRLQNTRAVWSVINTEYVPPSFKK